MEIKKSGRRDYDRQASPRRDYDGKPSRNNEGRRGETRSSFGAKKAYGNGKPSFGSRRSEDHPTRSSENRPSRSFEGRATRNFEDRPSRSFEGRTTRNFEERPSRGFEGRTLRPRKNSVKKVQEAPASEIRLNKFIANSGICSRREADRLIQAGAVTVNGVVVTELGTKVNVRKDTVLFGDQKLRGEEKVYLVMNKPKGFVTTTSDPHAEQTVMDLLTKCPTRVFPVGRLDKNTTGVLMFTNDGELSERLTHPSYNKKKIYEVTLDKVLSQEHFEQILSGVTLEDGVISADNLSFVDAKDRRKMGIEIHSGKNRIVRRIFESLGYQVKGLDRVYFAGLTKKGIKRGQWRYLSEGEVNILKMGAFN